VGSDALHRLLTETTSKCIQEGGNYRTSTTTSPIPTTLILVTTVGV